MRIFESTYLKFHRLFKLIGWDKFKNEKIVKVKDIIKEFNLYHLETEDINNPRSLKIISRLKPNVMVSCVFNQIYGPELIKIAAKGIINIHRSYLPFYRGISPTFWVLANNEKKTGISAHLITTEIDKGPILLQKKTDITKTDTIHTLSKRLMESIKKEFVLELINYVNNKKKMKVIRGGGSYRSWPDRKSTIRFIKNRRKLI